MQHTGSQKNGVKFFDTINLNTKVLKTVLDQSVKNNSRVIYFSSAAVYKTSKKKLETMKILS